MSKDPDLKYFKKCLEDRLKDIIADQEYQKQEVAPVELDQARIGRLSRLDALQQQAMSQAMARLTDQEHQRILAALGRLESGDYGSCILCDGPIAAGRLRFDPSVLTCIVCAEEAEKK